MFVVERCTTDRVIGLVHELSPEGSSDEVSEAGVVIR